MAEENDDADERPAAARGRASGAGRGAHRRHPRGAGHDQHARQRRAPRLALAGDGAARDHGARPDRDGRRQRRRRCLHLRAGGPELRHEPAVGAAVADPGADRQPGDGDPPGRGHGRRSRAADLRALRPVLGRVLGRRPVPPELPHDRHRVHRREPRARLLRREQVPGGAGRGGGAGRDHLDGELPQLGAVHVRVRRGELPGDPAAGPRAPARRRRRPSRRSCRASTAAPARRRCC